MTPAEQAERARLVAEVEEADAARQQHTTQLSRYLSAVRALAAFDAAHKGEG